MCEWIRALTSPVAAAWVQAIGSIGAIAAATWIASRQSREAAEREKREEQRRGESDKKAAYLLAMRLASILIDVEVHLVPAMKAVSKLELMEGPLAEDKGAVIDGLSLRTSWDEAIFDRFDLLPTKAAQVIAHLLYAVSRYDREMALLLNFIADHGGELEKAREKLAGNLERIRIDLNSAKSLLAPIVEQPP